MRDDGGQNGIDVGIRIGGAITLDIIQQLHLRFTTNHHGFMSAKGIVKSGASIEHDRMYGKTVVLELLDEEVEAERLLFQGILRSVRINKYGAYQEVAIEAMTGTCFMDIERKSRSFQNVDMTYADVIKAVVKDINSAAVICTAGKQKIGRPLIQYQETDWEFVKRLAGLAEAAIVPELKTGMPKFWFGMRKSRKTMALSTNSFQTMIHNRYINGAAYGKKDISYVLQGPAGLEIGDRLVINKQDCMIYHIEGTLNLGELLFYYWIGSSQMGVQEMTYKSNVSGISLKGTIEKTDGEKVCIKLNMDGNKESGSYEYEYASLTGNVMYCMPEKHTAVSLHYINEDERNAVVIDNPGWNTDCITNSDSALKRLEIDRGKDLFLFPSTIGISSMDSSGQISRVILADGDGAMLDSNKNMAIIANGSVNLKASAIHISVPVSIEINQSS